MARVQGPAAPVTPFRTDRSGRDVLAKELDRGRHAAFFHERQLATPCLTIDLQVIEARYRELHAALPGATIHYAIKAQPHPEVVAVLAALGSSFDVASAPELDL